MHFMISFRLVLCSAVLTNALLGFASPAIAQQDAAEEATAQPKLKFSKWSGEINVPDPVALGVDELGRVFVTQTRRRKLQDLDIREHREWVPEDVGLTSVEDKRQLFHEKLAVGGDQAIQKEWVQDVNQDGQHDWRDLTVISEVIYRLEDTDQDGTADEITTFAEDFKTEVTGIAAGVMPWAGKVYATVAPDLWQLTDADDDGVSDSQTSIAHGFGIHVAYGGHDMHGLAVGPDGKIYWSIGDKGINVTRADGRQFSFPNQGGVMRCNPDGSDFEVFAHGLRNVQEIAFDAHGNMFGVDNDADQTNERERFVYIVDGMDAGWRNNYQYRGSNYNPWTDEHLWDLPGEQHPAYIIPPLSHYIDGPAGFKFNPGTALSPSYKDYFFLTGAPNGYQYAFQVEPSGDSFKMVREHLIGSGLAIVGLAFGPDGALYGADWDGGYPLDEKGSVVKIDVDPADRNPARDEVAGLLKSGFGETETVELQQLLGHEDQRVRLGAQFELVDRNDAYGLAEVARDTAREAIPRIHGVWGLAQLGRSGDTFPRDTIGLLLTDKSPVVRDQAAKCYGEFPEAYAAAVIPLLKDDDLHVRMHAGLSLARNPTELAVPKLIESAVALTSDQHYLRHAYSLALSRCASASKLAGHKGHESEMLRLCSVLALRHQADPGVADFLTDASEWVATEAARAIHDDMSIEAALPNLARSLLVRKNASEAFVRRAVNANYRLGDAAAAVRVAQFAAHETRSEAERLIGLEALVAWLEPPPLDQVDGRNRDLSGSERQVEKLLVGRAVADLMRQPSEAVRARTIDAAQTLGLRLPLDSLQELVNSPSAGSDLRVAALDAVAAQLQNTIRTATRSTSPALQRKAIGLLGMLDEGIALETVEQVLESESPAEVKRECIQYLVAVADHPRLNRLAQAALAGDLSPELSLDVVVSLDPTNSESARLRTQLLERGEQLAGSAELAEYAFAVSGGDAKQGREIFNNHVEAQCSRCHRVGERGSEIGPELTQIAQKRDAKHLLKSLLDPSAEIDEKYRSQMFMMDTGEVIKGVLLSRDETTTTLADASGASLEIANDEIEDTSVQKTSLMPEIVKILSPREVRDVLAYLQSLK